MSLLTDYRANPSSTVLAQINNASIGAFNDHDRATLIQLIIDDIVSARNAQGRLASKDVTLALGAIKSLGRLESGSRVVASEKNLAHFLDVAKELSSDAEASKQAMRCIANAILLVPAGRERLVDLDGDEFCTRVYINEASSPEFIFLASRLLFFMTYTDGPFISRVVRQHRLPTLLAQQIENLGQSDAPFAKDALADILKLHFSAVAKYSKLVGHESGPGLVLGEYWDDVFEPTASPLIKLLHTLPSPSSNPITGNLTYAIHALLNVPVAPFAHLWFPQSPKPSRSSSSSTQSPRPSLDKGGSLVEGSGSGSGSGSPLSRALNLLNRKSSPSRKTPPPPPTGDSAIRALSILQSLLALHLPGNCEPDEAGVRAATKDKGVSLDEVAPPVVALVTRLAMGDEGAKSRITAVVLPTDMDRSSPLEKKDDFLGRCLRLMTSVYYPTLKDAIGEMLFVLCGSDGQALSAAIGYGNAAGYLYNKGIMAPPPASAAGDDVNPITGTREAPAGPSLSEMTDEEKQREAEKLFVLFDRMERMGMAKNPIREAFQSGKFENLPKKDDDSD
ncbi:Synembryn-B OS=Danio rerio GN=ric8b PE=2 SV=1 [Rhizoctonia solani AG-1 IB]|uniref:Synembryn-B n=1 Tax=Thanatephorus cucumeris (strain AG1-IB / isolate 7/3/14) TaxID=1108050 RepID=A0A0B7FSR1_THACB|nr:Synembryn-B OS=Danio rerio GN=ric8b PE=2 SV=1 [Rhizoctonia solani AG-1 IB]